MAFGALTLWRIAFPAIASPHALVQHWFNGQWTLWPVVGLVLALMIDISPAGGRAAAAGRIARAGR